MLKELASRITYANVIATIAVLAGLAITPAGEAQAAATGTPVVDRHVEEQLAAEFRSRGVRNFTPQMIRDVALAEIKTGTPAGVLASISEREFSHNTVRINGSIPGTVSSRGYYTAFAFKPSSWDYYKDQLWGANADSHDPFDYGDAAVMCGTILQHYREPGRTESNRMDVDPLGSLRDYNANYAAGVLADAEGKYGSPLWDKLIKNLRDLRDGVQVEPVRARPPPDSLSPEELLLLRLRMEVLRLLRDALPATY